MTLTELLEDFRDEADDATQPYLWNTDQIVRYANDAQMEACRRARLIIDMETPAICQIAVTAATPTYPLDARVIFVRAAQWTETGSNRTIPLRGALLADLEECWIDWERDTGTPTAYVRNFGTNRLRLYPIPDKNGTIQLRVVRSPLAPMKLKSGLIPEVGPEIAPRFHRSLVYYMLYRAFSKKDSAGEARDDKRAAEALAQFEAEFGPRSSALNEVYSETNYMADTLDGVF